VTAQTYEVVTKGTMSSALVAVLLGFEAVREEQGRSFSSAPSLIRMGSSNCSEWNIELLSINSVPTDSSRGAADAFAPPSVSTRALRVLSACAVLPAAPSLQRCATSLRPPGVGVSDVDHHIPVEDHVFNWAALPTIYLRRMLRGRRQIPAAGLVAGAKSFTHNRGSESSREGPRSRSGDPGAWSLPNRE
jgi:hypothetical protein